MGGGGSTGGTVLGLVGTAVGTYFGGSVGGYVGGAIGGYAGTAIDPPKKPASAGFSAPDVGPLAEAPAPPPAGSSPADSKDLTEAELAKNRNRKGRSSTILTGPLGLSGSTTTSPSTTRLLGN